MSVIDRVTVIPVATPFAKAFKLGSGSASGVDRVGTAVFVKLETNDGLVGWGEQRAMPTWSYETVETMVAVLRHHLVDLVIGLSPFQVELFHLRAEAALSPSVSNGMPFARVPVDIAMHDLAGQIAGVPINALLGGTTRDVLKLCSAIGAAGPEEMAQRATEASEYHSYKIKVTGDVKLDAARIRSVAEATDGKPLWLDANQSYTPSTYRSLIRGVADEIPQIVCAEQPVKSTDWAGLAAIRRWSPIPVAVDEGCFTATDLAKVVAFQATDMVVIKVCKAAGLRNSLKTAAVGNANGIELLGSGLTDCGVGFAAAVHVFSTLDLALPVELNGPELLAELYVDGVDIRDGMVCVPTGPGLGVTVREDALLSQRLDI